MCFKRVHRSASLGLESAHQPETSRDFEAPRRHSSRQRDSGRRRPFSPRTFAIAACGALILLAVQAASQTTPPTLLWHQTYDRYYTDINGGKHGVPLNFTMLGDSEANVWRPQYRIEPNPGGTLNYYASIQKRNRTNQLIWSKEYSEGVFFKPVALTQLGLWLVGPAKVELLDPVLYFSKTFGAPYEFSHAAIDAQGRLIVAGNVEEARLENDRAVLCFASAGLAWKFNLPKLENGGYPDFKTLVCHSDGTISFLNDEGVSGSFLSTLSENGVLIGKTKVAESDEVYHAMDSPNLRLASTQLSDNLIVGANRSGVHYLWQLTPQGATIFDRALQALPPPLDPLTYWILSGHADSDGFMFVNQFRPYSSTSREYRLASVDNLGQTRWAVDFEDVDWSNFMFAESVNNPGEVFRLFRRYSTKELLLEKWSHKGVSWSLSLGTNTRDTFYGFVSSHGDIYVAASSSNVSEPPGYFHLWGFAQAPEPLPDAPPQPALGPQPYRTESVLDNDRFATRGRASFVTNTTKGNVFLRRDGTFLYSPWGSTQNTTDTFEYRPVNGTAVGPPTKVTVKVGAVPRGTLTALKTSVSEIVGGRPVDGRVEVSLAAPTGGLGVALVSANEAVLRVPDIARVPAGRVRGTFQLSTLPVAISTSASFFAERIGARIWSSLTVKPPQLDSLATATGTAPSGSTFDLMVKLTGKAPAGGIVVGLKSSKVLLGVPKSVKVPEGFGSARFKAKVGTVSAPTSARVSATYGSRSRSVEVQLVP